MANQKTLEKPTANGRRGESEDAPTENHPLAGVIGSFAHDLPTLDAIMAGVEEGRRRMEADDNVP